MDFPLPRDYIDAMPRQPHLVAAITLCALAAHPGWAQRPPVAMEQISARPAASAAVRIAPVRGARSSGPSQERPREGGGAVAIAPEIVEACRKAREEDRPAPDGIDCLAVAQALGEAPPATAEGSLLQLFGQSGNVTGAPAAQAGGSVNADAVARQLSTGEVQGGSADGAAAIVGRERAAPPPNSPR